MSTGPVTRRIIPVNAIREIPEPDTLIADILNIFQKEITQFANKSRLGIIQGKTLPAEDARVLQGYAKMLVELSKEGRERQKAEDLSKMTDAELVAAMDTIRAQLTKGSVPSTATVVAAETEEK